MLAIDTVALVANWATMLGFPLAVGALVYAGIQFRINTKVARGQFILNLKTMLDLHKPTHYKLRPTQAWNGTEGSLPSTSQEWSDLEEYMGFFEHCEILIEDGSLNLDHFKHMFAYRVTNILSNPRIVEAKLLLEERDNWELFIRLCVRLGKGDLVGVKPSVI